MSDPGEEMRPEEADAALAAEYALRLLGPEDLVEVEARMARDPGFAALVARWQEDLGQFDAEFAPVAPPRALAAGIEARLFGARPSALARLWNSAALWRGVAAASILLAGYFGARDMRVFEAVDPGPRLISAVASIDSDVQLVASMTPRAAVLRIEHVSGGAPPGRALELWVLVEGDSAPVSLGLMPAAETFEVDLPPAVAGRVGPGTLVEVSEEPPGGSPTGRPSGAVLAKGSISAI